MFWQLIYSADKSQMGHSGFAYGTQGSDPLECTVSAVKSFRLRVHKALPLVTALTFRDHCFQRTWCRYFYPSLTFGCGHWLESLSLHIRLEVCGDSLCLSKLMRPWQLQWLSGLSWLVSLFSHGLPNLMAFPQVQCERQGKLSQKAMVRSTDVIWKQREDLKNLLFPHEPYRDDDFAYDLGEARRYSKITGMLMGQEGKRWAEANIWWPSRLLWRLTLRKGAP